MRRVLRDVFHSMDQKVKSFKLVLAIAVILGIQPKINFEKREHKGREHKELKHKLISWLAVQLLGE